MELSNEPKQDVVEWTTLTPEEEQELDECAEEAKLPLTIKVITEEGDVFTFDFTDEICISSGLVATSIVEGKSLLNVDGLRSDDLNDYLDFLVLGEVEDEYGAAVAANCLEDYMTYWRLIFPQNIEWVTGDVKEHYPFLSLYKSVVKRAEPFIKLTDTIIEPHQAFAYVPEKECCVEYEGSDNPWGVVSYIEDLEDIIDDAPRPLHSRVETVYVVENEEETTVYSLYHRTKLTGVIADSVIFDGEHVVQMTGNNILIASMIGSDEDSEVEDISYFEDVNSDMTIHIGDADVKLLAVEPGVIYLSCKNIVYRLFYQHLWNHKNVSEFTVHINNPECNYDVPIIDKLPELPESCVCVNDLTIDPHSFLVVDDKSRVLYSLPKIHGE